MTKEEFIVAAEKVHGDTYDYNEVIGGEPYLNVPIKCSRHGLFYQSIYDHLQGKGCFECYKEQYWPNNLC